MGADPHALIARAEASRRAGQLDDAIAAYRELATLLPSEGSVWGQLGHTLLGAGRHAEALAALERSLALRPDHAGALLNAALALRALGRSEEACARLDRAAALEPNAADVRAARGAVLRELARFDEAVAELEHALAIDPTLAHAHNDLGAALEARGELERALEHYRRACALDPDDAVSAYNLGSCAKKRARLEESETWLRRAVALDPTSADGHLNLGNTLQVAARVPEAIACYRRAIELDPLHAAAHSNLLLALHYEDACTADELAAEHRAWGERHARGNPLPDPPPGGGRGKIRIGYLSPDFREHSVAYFLEPLLQAHDRARVELFAYAEVAHPDLVTERLRAHFDAWRDTVARSDAEVAAQIRADDVDVLVDLAGHTASSRLRVAALRPARVAVSYLGYPDTTGMPQIDARLTDAWADPDTPEVAARYLERLVRIEGGFLCYAPDPAVPPPPPPSGPITFGSFNAAPKLSRQTIALWAELLARVAGSRLLLKSPSFADDSVKARLRAAFAAHGVAPERIDLRGYLDSMRDHLLSYGEVQVALDPFPYCGTTTTCEALSMGVPVVSLVGDRHASRVGASVLAHVGMPELATDSRAAYLEMAARLCEPERQHTLRQAIPKRLRASPLCDAPRLARAIERAFEELLAERAR